jgi:DNA-binding GntR family transcriptional regulator
MSATKRTRTRRSGTLPEFETVLPKTRRAQVAETIRNFVLGGKIQPGTQLIESRLAASLGVSRSSIREAIWELIDQGLLVNRPYAGTFVVSLDEKTMRDLFSLRGAIERHCFTELWPRRNDAFRREFTARHDALAQAIHAGRQDEIVAAEMAFHSYPYQFADNQTLLDVWEQLANKVQLGFAMTRGFSRDVEFIENSRRFLDAALGDDLDTMLKEIDRHLAIGIDDIHRLMSNEGENTRITA